MLYQINKGCKYFGAQTVFEDIQFEIKNTEKIAIVGRNGCGKSTLLKCMTHELELDQGTIHQLSGTTIGYLAQTTFSDEERTVQEEMNLVFQPIFDCKKELEEITERMTTDHSEKILEKFAQVQEKFEQMNGYNYQAELLQVFTKFGFTKEELDRRIETFSGGQRTRLAFVKLLLSKPDILLLDEPTNHLDLETIEWLEGYLKRYEKAVVLVSHDRTFLDQLAEVVYEIEYGEMSKYIGNYSSYVEQKKLEYEKQGRAYERQQKEIERLEALIEKFRYKRSKAAFAQSKIKYLDRMERIDKPQEGNTKTFHAHFTPHAKGGKRVLEVEDLVIGYDKPLSKINLEVLSGQRIAILGANGTGKSTFLKTIMSIIPALSGNYLLGHQIDVGYFDQQLAQFNTSKTVLEELWDDYPDLDRTTIRSVLGQFLFSSDEVFKTVDVLSGGEKVRLSFAKLLLKHSNFLVLDEPTNHLDIQGKEALEESLKGFEGTILFVSHDRYFIKKIATSVLLLDDSGAHFYPYGYQEYLDHGNKQEEVKQAPKIKIEAEKPKIKPINAKREIAKIEGLISEKEELLEAKRELRFDPEYYHDYEKMNDLDEEIDQIHNELNQLMEKWEELSEFS
ncbi:ABC-F family ATP-binding cassette domain-containing protein [Anaerorhabdus furcosa]|uniref:ATP-binding cassette, subfamily F, member 3 n=1 Tax=Anaerorhabdus furcosa TaxID=118967 RepID=A0A1T4PQJ1_9FIRM|nr:ABC-F family ATP-binding cassette domain-containing protein [Anaerorhabdus furcosa]SJZ93679.1 ATP-binding cassette, subfamily F, member 3 [Anaerorhabdus furcosa]